MQATRFEYRFRYALHTIVYALGFVAPWNYWLHLDHFHTTWEWAAMKCSALGMQAGVAFIALLVVAIVCAAAGAGLRAWGGAYLGYGVVQSAGMHGSAIVADGPFRRSRNPLYLGTFLHTLAVALIMPPTGALFAVLVLGIFQLRLIFAEEPFLTAKLGQAYADYCARVPRLLPALTPRVAASGTQPQWQQAIIGEIYMIAVAVSFAVFGWQYNAWLLTKCVVISLGVSLIARAMLPRKPESATQTP